MSNKKSVYELRKMNQFGRLMYRGMTKQEVHTLLTAPMSDRERAFFRCIYETFLRLNELLQCDIEDYNKVTGELIARVTKTKYNPKSGVTIKSPPKHVIPSETCRLLFTKVISYRKKGPIFVNKRGERLTKTWFQIQINKIAKRIGIQKVALKSGVGKDFHLVTCKAIREAGERHCDLNGADRDATARMSQHSVSVKEKYYKKAGWEDIHDQVRKFHPCFNGEM